VVLPWQIPVNQLASVPARADLALALGFGGGLACFALMLWRMARLEATR
jgi:ABC-2 type transport system permease protein